MAFLNRRSLAFLIFSASIPAVGSAQDLHARRAEVVSTQAGVVRVRHLTDSRPLAQPNLQRAAARMHADRWSTAAPQNSRPNRRRMGLAIAIGIGAGAGATALAASRYGANEGGSFCARCFAEWSAIAIPVGAGVGAAVGYLIDRERR